MVRRAVLGGAALCAAVLLAGCAAPENHYVAQAPGAAAAGKVYFTVPYSWTAFPASAIATAESGWSSDSAAQSLLSATAWQEAFDASSQPSLDHVLGSGVPESPTVYASLRTLYDAEKGAASTEALRDLVVPVSKLTGQVEVLSEERLAVHGLEGVHLVLALPSAEGRPEQTIDQTAFLSDGKDAVYLLVVRCTTACYDEHADEIARVTSSYTIQGDPSG